MTLTNESTDVLSAEMLARIDERAPKYDRDNTFFTESFEELRAAGYLDLAVPPEFGGPGLRLDAINQLQRRLAYHDGATALGVNMHFYWTGLAADLHRGGDPAYDWILEEASRGAVFAAGHGEAGNDIPVLLSTAGAERADGGWKINAHKIFGSLSPVWTYLGFHAMDTSNPEAPQVVHGFLHRDDPGHSIVHTWDTLGMRATQSDDTLIEGAFVPDSRVPLVCPAGFAGAGPFHVGLFAWALLGFAGVYAGMARRAYDIAVANAHQRTSIALTRSMAYHPEVQRRIAEMRVALEAMDALLDRTVTDWAIGVDHGHDWVVKIVATKSFVVNAAYEVVDTALDLSGGSGVFKRNRLEQLFRDTRMGRFHPANGLLVPELIGKLSLGINPDEAPRWG